MCWLAQTKDTRWYVATSTTWFELEDVPYRGAGTGSQFGIQSAGMLCNKHFTHQTRFYCMQIYNLHSKDESDLMQPPASSMCCCCCHLCVTECCPEIITPIASICHQGVSRIGVLQFDLRLRTVYGAAAKKMRLGNLELWVCKLGCVNWEWNDKNLVKHHHLWIFKILIQWIHGGNYRGRTFGYG